MGEPGSPVVRVGGGGEVVVRAPRLEDIGASADRVVGAAVRRREHRRGGGEADLLRGEGVREGHPRSLHRQGDRPRAGLLVALDEGLDGDAGQGALVLAVDVGQECRTIAGRAVVERDVGPHGDGPLGEVLVRRERLGEVGDYLAGGGDRHEGVEDGAAVEEARPVEAPGARVEPLLLGAHPDGEVAALARLGPGHTVAPRPVGGHRSSCGGEAVAEGGGSDRPGGGQRPA